MKRAAHRLVLGGLLLLWIEGNGRAQGMSMMGGPEAPAATARKELPGWRKRLAGSFVDLSLYVGTGSFYASGYRHPYVAGALYLKPQVNLHDKRKLSLNARFYLLQEFTDPDNNSAQRFMPLDTWIWLSAGDLYTEKRSKIRLSALFRLVLPTSYESLYSNLALGIAGGLGLSRAFELPRKVGLRLSVASAFTKNFHTATYRGKGPGDTTGCRGGLTAAATASGAPGGGTTVGDSDLCGGPLNTSYSFVTSGTVSLSVKRFSLAVTLIVINAFKYDFPRDQYTAAAAVDRGQSDSTWGLISLGYEITDHFGVSLGLSSLQPAFDSRYRKIRFPFFDFESSASSANYTQLFAGVNGTL